MKRQTSLTTNFIMNTFLTISSFIFPLITFPYVSRILLPVGIGKISFATSIVTYFSMLAQLGIPTYGIRACARIRDNSEELTSTVHELFVINLIMSLFSYIIFFLVVLVTPKLWQERFLFFVISSTIFFNLIGMEWLYKALEQYTYITIRSVFFKFVAIIAMFLLVHEQSDYILYSAISIFAASASGILNFFNVHKLIAKKRNHPYNLHRHMKPVLIFFAMSCATTVYTNLDTIMLGFLQSDIEVGLYNAAVKVKTILLGFVTSLGTVLLPRVSYYLENNMVEEFRRIAAKAMHFVFLLAGPLCIYFIIFAEESILFLAGSAYSGAVLSMQIIMPTLILVGLTNIMGIQMLVPMGKEIYVLYSEIVGACLDLILNMILIPFYGAAGAAIGTLVAETAVLLIQFYFLKTEVWETYREICSGTLAGAVLAGVLASIWMKYMNWRPFFLLLVSSVSFFGIYFIFLLIRRDTVMIGILDRILKNKYTFFSSLADRKTK